MALVFITITGFDNDEMPIDTCPSADMLCLNLKGLCVGRGVQMNANKTEDHVIFICNNGDKDTKKKMCLLLQGQNILALCR